jgi:hypothetical protein
MSIDMPMIRQQIMGIFDFLSAHGKAFSGDELLARNIKTSIWHHAHRINEPDSPVKSTLKYFTDFSTHKVRHETL